MQGSALNAFVCVFFACFTETVRVFFFSLLASLLALAEQRELGAREPLFSRAPQHLRGGGGEERRRRELGAREPLAAARLSI